MEENRINGQGFDANAAGANQQDVFDPDATIIVAEPGEPAAAPVVPPQAPVNEPASAPVNQPAEFREPLPQFGGNPYQPQPIQPVQQAQREPLPQFGNPYQAQQPQPVQPIQQAQREPLPQFGNPYQAQYGGQPGMNYQQSQYGFVRQEKQAPTPEFNESVNAAFGKALTAAILGSIPFVSFLGIIFGFIGLSLTNKAKEIASNLGIPTNGKLTASLIMSIAGMAVGGISTLGTTISIFMLIIEELF